MTLPSLAGYDLALSRGTRSPTGAPGPRYWQQWADYKLEAELSNAQVIDVTSLNAGSKVVFGATVDLADSETDEEKTYQIVGDLEADIKQGMIAISSPVARALIGKFEGDVITIDAPARPPENEIVGVRYEA